MIETKEVYEDLVRVERTGPNDMIQIQTRKVFSLRDCMINPDYIVAVYPHRFTSDLDREMIKSIQTDEMEKSYSRVILDGNNFRKSEIIIDMSYEKLARILR